ncbi:MAG TPA: hypothetical protein VHD90_09860 [Phototrophicaceae bacterium]|nr:hypothetical protein [Phototrophicaceae bacterium]
MLSWKLWRAINHPPQHSPLYRRVYIRQLNVQDEPLNLRIPLLGLFKNAGLIILPVVIILLGTPILVLLYYLALLIAPILLPFANTIYGLIQVVSVSGSIARERQQQTYDVICTAPQGVLGMHWSYCVGWIHFHWLYRAILLGILSIGIVASVFGVSPQAVFGGDQVPLAITIFRALVLGVLFVIDYAQTMVVSSLITLIAPVYAENEGNARLWAASLFLTLQLAVYGPTLLFGLFALPSTFTLIGFAPLVSDLLIPLLLLGFFVALRETIISGLWHTIRQQLTTDAVELDAISGLAL